VSASLVVNSQNFDQEVLQSELPVLVDFWAPGCRPCQTIAPAVDALAEEMAGKLKVVKVNTDEEREVAGKYGIMSIPTLLVIKGGKVLESLVGTQSKSSIAAKVQRHLS
jgi:thioredoxin 1